ncbi:MAG: antibiotic biosynthesis monooxygenase [Planctomycetota bacterium]
MIFTTLLREDAEGYAETAARMEERAATFPGYLGLDGARGPDGVGVTCSYWRTREDFERWRDDPEHVAARERGRRDWYAWYELRFARVERSARWTRAGGVEAT